MVEGVGLDGLTPLPQHKEKSFRTKKLVSSPAAKILPQESHIRIPRKDW